MPTPGQHSRSNSGAGKWGGAWPGSGVLLLFFFCGGILPSSAWAAETVSNSNSASGLSRKRDELGQTMKSSGSRSDRGRRIETPAPTKGSIRAEVSSIRKLDADGGGEGEWKSEPLRSRLESYRSERDKATQPNPGRESSADQERSQMRLNLGTRLEAFLEFRRESREETKMRLAALKQDLKSHREVLIEAQADSRALTLVRSKGRKGAED